MNVIDKKKLLEEIETVNSRVIRVEDLFILITSKLGIKITEAIETAAVSKDGYLLINPGFWQKLNIHEKTLVLSHEYTHVILEHLIRMEDFSDFERFNFAADVHCNRIGRYIAEKAAGREPDLPIWHSLVTAEKIAKIAQKYGISVTPKEIEQMTTEEIYELLGKIQQAGGGRPWKNTGTGSSTSSSAGFDENHSASSGENNTSNNGSSTPENTKPGDIGSGKDIVENSDDYDGEVIKEPSDEFKDAKKNGNLDNVWRNIARKVEAEAMRRKVAGQGSALTDAIVKAIDYNKVPWTKIVLDTIEKDYKYRQRTYKRQNRRLRNGNIIYPGYQRRPQPTLVVFIDVSGSMDEEQISKGLGELNAFMRKLHGKTIIVQWDDGIINVEEVKGPVNFLNRYGAGGTSFVNSYREFKEKYPKEFKKLDNAYVLIVSDMYWFDNRGEATKVLKEIEVNAARLMALDTTSDTVAFGAAGIVKLLSE